MKNTKPNPKVIDINIHGIVGIRLIDPTAGDASAILDLLGPAQSSLNQPPDIIIRFKKELSVHTLKYLGLNSSGFSDEGFYVFDRKNGKVNARIPFEKIGNHCDILCRSGLGSVPLLFDIIKLTFIRKNYIAVHASAFHYNDSGVLLMGWSKGGKTEGLFSFANHGASYIGDECVVLSRDGNHMFGIPFPVTIWDWQFKYIPDLLPKIGKQKKILFKGIHFAITLHRTFRHSKLKKAFWLKILDEALPAFKRQLKVVALPQVIFQNGYFRQRARPDKLFLMMGHSEPVTHVEPCHPEEIAQRMHQSNAFEQMDFFEYYRAFKFAFPDLRNDLLEHVDEHQRSLLSGALTGKEGYKVLHPYPVSFKDLFIQMQPFCEKTV